MVDWKGLYNWSMKYTDGTKPSDFKQMSKEEILKVIDEVFAKVKPTSEKEMGIIMKEINPLVKGKADMKEVSTLIKEKLSSL